METVKNLRKMIYVMRSVKSWINTVAKLSSWKENGLRQIDIRFKDSTFFTKVTLGTAWALIIYYYWSKRLGSYNRDDLIALEKTCENIYQKIGENCQSWPKGGWGLQGTHGILFLIVRKYKPELFVETGIAHGYSSTIILKAMEMNGFGSLISIDASDHFEICGKTTPIGWVVPEDLRNRWSIRLGLSSDVLQTITESIDIFYHDSSHTEENMTNEYKWARNHLKHKGILISDDIDDNRAWVNFHKSNRDMEELLRTVTTGVSIKS
jgi:predicted O-methyltransferase YrrM